MSAFPILNRRWRRNERNEAIAGYLFLAPSFIALLALTIGPVIASLVLSLMDWSLLSPPSFAGLDNYKRLVTDPEARHALQVTFVYLIGAVPLGLFTSLGLALAMNTRIRGIGLFRTVYFIPVVSSMVAVGLMFRWIFNTEFGILNYALNGFFDAFNIPLRGPAWLQDPGWAMPAIILMTVWKTAGYNMVILLAGLQGISEHYYEAAMIDGAGRWSRFVHITIPLLSPTIFFVVIVSMIGSFQVFDQAFILTLGGPARSTVTLVYYLYENAFQWSRMGYAAAVAWFLFLVIFIFTFAQWTLQKRWVFYG